MNIMPISKIIKNIAQVAHEANRAHCRMLGDLHQPSWDEAPEWQKAGCHPGRIGRSDEPRYNAAAVSRKLDGSETEGRLEIWPRKRYRKKLIPIWFHITNCSMSNV